MDEEEFKNRLRFGKDYYDELLQTIKEIRFINVITYYISCKRYVFMTYFLIL